MGLIEVGLWDRVKGRIFSGSPDPNNQGLFDHLESGWKELPIRTKKWFLIGICTVLIVIWFCKPGLAQFIGYLLGGLLLLRQIEISGQRATATEKTAEAMQKTAQLTEKGNIDERFKNAIEHLGHESASIRLGGIYALHHIAQDVDEYCERVFEILCAHIRETTTKEAYEPRIVGPGFKEPTIEIQSILNILFVKTPECERYNGFVANLETANLRGIRLIGAKLDKADLLFADLREAILAGTSMQDVSLYQTDLRNTRLWNAKNLKTYQLLKAKTLYEAKLPEGMAEIIRQQKPELLEKPSDEDDA